MIAVPVAFLPTNTVMLALLPGATSTPGTILIIISGSSAPIVMVS